MQVYDAQVYIASFANRNGWFLYWMLARSSPLLQQSVGEVPYVARANVLASKAGAQRVEDGLDVIRRL